MRDRVLPEIVQALWKREPLLQPGEPWQPDLDGRIGKLQPERWIDGDANKLQYAQAVQSGLYLWNDSLNASHELSQRITNETGSYLHGMMHRMEGDYPNASYWFRTAGSHPVASRIQNRVQSLVSGHKTIDKPNSLMNELIHLSEQSEWNPVYFTALVERACEAPESTVVRTLQAVQRIEVVLLLEYSYQVCCEESIFDYIV
ncbi:hypothetical protein [Paenibacillus senegalensis]|uniref:hypothetical protein n=1 Tax=Paenibacillus senegalensis TaxID=1465766 RepID=UPI00028829F3|nr:hypothetical protein [Paenibacillus senegalensis]